MYAVHKFPVWIVSDLRREEELEYFRYKRPEEISQMKMFNRTNRKTSPYYMNFKLII